MEDITCIVPAETFGIRDTITYRNVALEELSVSAEAAKQLIAAGADDTLQNRNGETTAVPPLCFCSIRTSIPKTSAAKM